MSAVTRDNVRAEAARLRHVAELLAATGARADWSGPAQRECDRHVKGLEFDLRDIARSLGIAADYAGVHRVMADL